jgi:hypothetical protein
MVYLTPEDPKPGRFYLLPKIHKQDNPRRPIVSANGRPTENISEFIDSNTFLFKIHIKDTKLCSFCNVEDETVEHLFFNCPLIFPFLRAFYDCLKRYFHNIEFLHSFTFFLSLS